MRLSLVAVVLCALTATANAASVSLAGLKLGKTAVGPDLQQKDLKGKCTLVVYWGTH